MDSDAVISQDPVAVSHRTASFVSARVDRWVHVSCDTGGFADDR